MNIRRSLLVGCFALLLAACTGGDDEEMAGGPFESPSGGPGATEAVPALSAAAETDEEVVVRDATFDPSVITISTGSTVSWVNEDEMGHTVTHGEGGAPKGEALFDEALSADQAVSYTFEEAGEFPVTCKVHKDMQMTVVVEDGD